MTQSPVFLPFDAQALPPAVVRYLDVQSGGRDRQSVLDVFTANARVTDEGITHQGLDAIHRWLGTAATEYTYTTTLIGQRTEEPHRWVVLARLEGDFPGGIADLRFQFTTTGDLIAELVIAP